MTGKAGTEWWPDHRVALAATLLLLPVSGEAQQRGDTQQSNQSVVFTTEGQSVWGPGTEAALSPWSYEVFTAGWDATLSASESGKWQGLEVGGGFDLTTEGSTGLIVGMDQVTAGALSITYPVGSTLTFPAPNTFRDGEPVTISTAWELDSGGEIASQEPNLRVFMGVPFQAKGGVDFRICVLNCYENNQLSIDTGPTQTGVFGAKAGEIIVGENSVDADEWEFTIIEKFLLGISGRVEVPNHYPTGGSKSGNALSTSISQQWVDVSWDIDALLANLGVTPRVGFGVNLNDDVVIGYNLYDFDMDLDHRQHRSFEFEATPQVTVDFPVAVQWWVTDGAGAPVGGATSSTASLEVGHDLHVVFPSGRKAPLVAETEFAILRNTLQSEGSFSFAGQLRDTLLSASLKVPSNTGEKYLKVDEDIDWDFDCDPDTWTQVACDIARALSGAAREVSRHWNKTVTDIFDWVSHTFGEVDLKAGPEETSVITTWDDTYTYHHDTWEMGGFSARDGAAFTLDPEDPIITLGMGFSNGLAEGGAPGTVAQTLTVTNAGDVKLSGIQIAETIIAQAAAAGLTVTGITSSDFMTDGFDGAGDTEMLDGFDELGVGDSGEVTVTYSVDPDRTVSVDATTSGTSPIGTGVSGDASASFGFGSMRIVPKKLNRSSQGVLPVHLYGSAQIPASEVDVGTLGLEGAPVVEMDTEDVNDDGLMDLVLKFDRQAVLAGFDARTSAPAALVVDRDALARGFERPTLELVRMAVLQGRTLTPDQRRAIDRHGNANGRVDLGDLRQRILEDNGLMAVAKKKGGPAPAGNGDGSGEEHTFILSGALNHGTPLWAEDELELIGG